MKLPVFSVFASVVLLSACATQPPEVPAKAPEPVVESPADQLEAQLAELESMGLSVAREADGFMITVPGAMAFGSGRSVLDPAAREALDRIATAMTAVASTQAEVIGHTDSMGAAKHNQALSEARADAVVAYIAGKGVDTARLSAKGMGEGAPVADNATAEGRAANRRVEIIIKRM